MSDPSYIRLDAPPFRIAARGLHAQQVEIFAAKALWAWRYVLDQLGTSIRAGWPADWPPSFPKVIDIAANDAVRIPEIRWSKFQILYSVPAEKLRAGFDSCVAHELTHLLAPGFGRSDHTLREGLAVHLQALFDNESDDRSYPTEGGSLHEKTRALIQVVGHQIPLREVDAKWLNLFSQPERQLAYLEAGSFVRFLVERFGMQKYLRVHDGEDYASALQYEYRLLEADWLSFLN